jgi:hypothetical protein
MPKPEDYILKRSGLTLAEIYAADEWDGVRSQMPVPALEDKPHTRAVSDILQTARKPQGKRRLH